MRTARLLLAGLLLAATPTAAEAPALDQDAIAYRKHIMKTLEAQFNAMAGIIAFDGPAENLTSHLTAALLTARMVLPSFAKEAPGGSSQPHIWTQWEDYTMHAQEFEAAIAMALEAAKFASLTDIVWYTDQVSCRKCHEAYKQRGVSGGEEYLGY